MQSLMYETLTPTEQDNNHCQIILTNRLACKKKAVVRIGNVVLCSNHFELEKAFARAKNQKIEEIKTNEPNANTNENTN